MIELFDKDYGKLEVEFLEDKPFLHFNAKKFSKEIYNQMLDDMVDVSQAFKEAGHNALFVLIEEDNHKAIKFQTMLGFEPRATLHTGHIIMVYYIGE